jgi:hypothetical protein
MGVTYDSQATHRKQGGLPVRAPLPRRIPIGRLGVIYNSQLPEIHKLPPQTGGSSYFLIEKSPKTAFFITTLNKI